MNIQQKTVILIEKKMKTYSKAVILALQNLWKHTKIQFLMSPLRHIDCPGKHSEAVIYRNEGLVIYSHAKTTFESILQSVNSLDAKPMKSWLYSVQYSSGETKVWLFNEEYTCNNRKKLPFKTDWASWNGYQKNALEKWYIVTWREIALKQKHMG